MFARALVVAISARSAGSARLEGPTAPVLWLNVNSAAGLIQRQKRPASDALIAFVSRSPDLLRIARTMLVAASWAPDALILKDARIPGWKRGMRSCAFVIADAITLRDIPAGVDVKRLRLIAESSLAEIRQKCKPPTL